MSWVYATELPDGPVIKRQLHLTPEAISFQGNSIPMQAIEQVRMEVVRRYTNGIPTATGYKIQLEGNGFKLTPKWGFASLQKKETKARCEEAYKTLTDLLDHFVGPRIVQAQLAQPFPATFGSYEITPHWIASKGLLGTDSCVWPQVTGVDLNQGSMAVTYVNDKGSNKRLGGMTLWTPNAWFLPEIIDAYRKWFLGQPQQ